MSSISDNPTRLPPRTVPPSAIKMPAFGFGCAPLDDLFVEISEPQARLALNAAWDAESRYYDTALGISTD